MKKNTKFFLVAISLFAILLLPKISFAKVVLSIDSVQSTTVSLRATGLSFNQPVKFTVTSASDTNPTPDYTQSISANEGLGVGYALAYFVGLNPKGDYFARVFDDADNTLAMLNFSTPSDTGTNQNSTGKINGACGSASGKEFLTAPTDSDNLCSAGVTTSVDGIGPWVWKCQGQNGGSDSLKCLAKVSSKSAAKVINSFSVSELGSKVDGKIDYSNHTISLEVFSGVDINNLKPTIQISDRATISPNTGTAEDFSSPVVYTVTAENGSTQDYTVTANTATENILYVTDITSNSAVLNAKGLISGKEVKFTVNTSTENSPEIPVFSPPKGEDFVSGVSEKGIASFPIESGLAPGAKYTVSINYTDSNETLKTTTFSTVDKKLSSDKKITAFSFTGLAQKVDGTIYDSNNTIDLYVPKDTDLTKLTPTISISNNATIDPASDVVQDFSNPLKPVVYTVTAEDGSTQKYIVNVSVDNTNIIGGGGNSTSANTATNSENVVDTSANQTSFPNGLVPCINNCNWNYLLTMVNNVVKFVIVDLIVPIAAIMFAYAGFELITSGGSTEKRTKAKKMFTSVAIGIVLVVAAWLIIFTISSILGYNGAWIGFK